MCEWTDLGEGRGREVNGCSRKGEDWEEGCKGGEHLKGFERRVVRIEKRMIGH